MDRLLLQTFIESARDRLVDQRIGTVNWHRPILSIPVHDRTRRRFLVAIMEMPGPFLFLSEEDPLAGFDFGARFAQASGARIVNISSPEGDRLVDIEADDRSDIHTQPLHVFLYMWGSYARAELTRGGTVLQAVGGGGPRGRPPSSASAGFSTSEAASLCPDRPFFLVSPKRPGRVAPVESGDRAAAFRFGPFEDMVEACGEVGGVLLRQTHGLWVEKRLRPISQRLAAQKRLVGKLDAERRAAADHEKLRRETETLAAYQSRIPAGAHSIELADIFHPGSTITIELDPADSISSQIEKRFKRAKKLKRSERYICARIEELSREIERLEAGIAAIRGDRDFARAMNELDRFVVGVPRSPRAGASRGRVAPTGSRAVAYRRFELDENWFVLVGRSNKENDELTFHTAAPSDLWFHAQHVPGSHVVLKSKRPAGSPSGHILETTASIAAYYSKAKHSGVVPVIYTQRKYVRKPRGARPGQVVCEREKTIFAQPALPKSQG